MERAAPLNWVTQKGKLEGTAKEYTIEQDSNGCMFKATGWPGE